MHEESILRGLKSAHTSVVKCVCVCVDLTLFKFITMCYTHTHTHKVNGGSCWGFFWRKSQSEYALALRVVAFRFINAVILFIIFTRESFISQRRNSLATLCAILMLIIIMCVCGRCVFVSAFLWPPQIGTKQAHLMTLPARWRCIMPGRVTHTHIRCVGVSETACVCVSVFASLYISYALLRQSHCHIPHIMVLGIGYIELITN